MQSKVFLKYSVLVIMILLVVLPFLASYEMENAPELLKKYIDSEPVGESITLTIIAFTSIILIISNFISCIGILVKKTWSRWYS